MTEMTEMIELISIVRDLSVEFQEDLIELEEEVGKFEKIDFIKLEPLLFEVYENVYFEISHVYIDLSLLDFTYVALFDHTLYVVLRSREPQIILARHINRYREYVAAIQDILPKIRDLISLLKEHIPNLSRKSVLQRVLELAEGYKFVPDDIKYIRPCILPMIAYAAAESFISKDEASPNRSYMQDFWLSKIRPHAVDLKYVRHLNLFDLFFSI